MQAEDPEESCRALAYYLAHAADLPLTAAVMEMMVRDLLTKSAHVRPEAKTYFLASALRGFAPERVRGLLEAPLETKEFGRKLEVDVALVNIKGPEFDATMYALGLEPDAQEARRTAGLRFWETEVSRGSAPPLRTVVTWVGDARNLQCALACEKLFSTYDVKLAILVGIGAGLRGKTVLGDVVCAELVIDYEGARLEPEGPRRRPTPYPLDPRIEADFWYFDPARCKWHDEFASALARLGERGRAGIAILKGRQPDCHKGVVIAGEKLFGDGSIPNLRNELHEKVRAADMEGSGFARSCRGRMIPWLVFRGVSDYGDPEKEGSDPFQVVAALSAATTALSFLRHEYRGFEDTQF